MTAADRREKARLRSERWRRRISGRDGAAGGMRVEYKKAPDRPREVRYATGSGARVTSLGGNQARLNKQYSGQSWRLPWPE
jgi:hypothetical protein